MCFRIAKCMQNFFSIWKCKEKSKYPVMFAHYDTSNNPNSSQFICYINKPDDSSDLIQFLSSVSFNNVPLIIQMLPRPASTLSSPLPSIIILSCLSLASLPCSFLFHFMLCHPHFLTPLISSFFSLLQINPSTFSCHIK